MEGTPTRQGRGLRLLVVSAALALLALGGGARVVGATPAPAGGRIVFDCACVGSNQDVYSINADGTNAVRLTDHPAWDGDPSLSPDGTKIAFVSTRDAGGSQIYVMDVDGSHLQRLTDNAFHDGDPAWSPDGTRIAFASDRDHPTYDGSFVPEVYVMNADGSAQTRVTTTGGGQPSWSPDGTKIAYETYGVLHVIGADGTGDRVLESGTTDDHPAWSPDGSTIAFDRYSSAGSSLYTVPAAGGAATELATTAANAGRPAWSPDGQWLAFDTGDPRFDGTFSTEVGVIAADGSDEHALVSAGSPEDPSWGTAVDTTPPSIPTVRVPGDGVDLQTFAFEWTTDEPATAQCEVDSRGLVPCTSPWTASGFSDGVHTFTLVVTDTAGNSSTFQHSWIEDLNNPSGSLPAGGTLTTDPLGFGAQPGSPVEVSLTTPVAGDASISETAAGAAPAGYSFLGQEVDITAPVATAASPLRITFDVDQAILSGATAATLQLFRNGVVIADCPGSAQAVPDPCVSSRVALAGGDVLLTVNTSHASVWNLGTRLPVAVQLDALIARVSGLGLGPLAKASLLVELLGVKQALAQRHPAAACAWASLFTIEIRALAGRGIPPPVAAGLVADATGIRASIPC